MRSHISVYTTLSVDINIHIYEEWLAIDRRVCDHNGYVESDVELAVGEDRRGGVEGNFGFLFRSVALARDRP